MFIHGLVLMGVAFGTISPTLIKPRVYEVQNVNSTCTSDEFKIRLELNRKFRGIVYAKGFPLEKSCSAYGTGESFVDISVDTSGCGVRIVSTNDEVLTYRISLNVQMDRFLQQITDLEVSATCNLPLDMMQAKTIVPPVPTRQISRTGRNKVSDMTNQIQNDKSNQIKSWMEIEGTSETSHVNKVFVGEQTMMLIKSFLPENVDASVVDCYAYDGTRDVIQKLLDDEGCPLDRTIMPSLEHIKYEGEEEEHDDVDDDDDDNDYNGGEDVVDYDRQVTSSKRDKTRDEYDKLMQKKKKLITDESKTAGWTAKEKMRLRVMGTIFSAFKFPDTSNLHLRCSLQLCRNSCPQVSCDSDSDTPHIRLGKSVKSEKNSSNIIEKIEVFNSVEVLAPGIDADGFATNQDEVDATVNPKENSFCLSTSKMAIAFAILGAVFLCGVFAVLWTVMRNHMRKVGKTDGSEQILVVRDSPLNFRNSQNKLYHHWSYS